MNGIEKSNRRVEMSAVLSDAVYEYEKAYTSGQKDPTLKADDVLKEAGIITKSYEIVDSMYDKDSGVAAIAVKDKLTEEPPDTRNCMVLVFLTLLFQPEILHKNVLLLL